MLDFRITRHSKPLRAIPALFFGTLNTTGTIRTNKRADLVLLDANPLEDIANTQKRAGVMLKGKILSASRAE